MQIDLDKVKREFTKLMDEDIQSERTVELLVDVWEYGDLSPDDAGWALWNLCDRYALARDPMTQHRYQSRFFDLVKSSFPERAHWVVCDGTQAMTLVHGGFLEFWWGYYQFANNNAPRIADNRGARFEAHRANSHSYLALGEIACAESAIQELADILEEDNEWPNQAFASVTYKQY